MNSERKIPLWWEFHSAATSLPFHGGSAFEKGVCIFKGRSPTTHFSAGGGGPSRGWSSVTHPGTRFFASSCRSAHACEVGDDDEITGKIQLWTLKFKWLWFMWMINEPHFARPLSNVFSRVLLSANVCRKSRVAWTWQFSAWLVSDALFYSL